MNDIRAMIRERGMTLESVARALQITNNTLTRKLNGEVEFRLCEAKTLAPYKLPLYQQPTMPIRHHTKNGARH